MGAKDLDANGFFLIVEQHFDLANLLSFGQAAIIVAEFLRPYRVIYTFCLGIFFI